ncbi:MAG: AI-2E family transporter [Candidatus Avoscillospira sp.]
MKNWKEHQYFNLGLMILSIAAISIVLLAIVLNLPAVAKGVKTVLNVFSPVINGIVFAYLLNPLMNFMDRRLYPFLLKRKMQDPKAKKLSHAVSLVFALVLALLLIYEFFNMLLPQLVESVTGIVSNLSTYYADAEQWVLGFLDDNPELRTQVDVLLSKFYDFLTNWINNDLLANINQVFTSVTTSVMSVVNVVLDLVIGFVAAIYMLWSRDTFLAQIKKLIVALFKERTADHLLDLGRRVNQVFSGFIIGKLVDSLIIGFLCYFGMLILHLPFPALIATIIGVTNIIPFFGPFIGAVPSAVLILLVDPLKCLYFILFVLVLQQVDGNIIGPRILGNTIGISGFWVLVSITVAGGLFGFAGMVLGVPVFAVLYMLVSDLVSSRLKKKRRTTDTAAYYAIEHVEDLPAAEPEEPDSKESL